ncbi:carboxypeptidase-like regulatory domain-containing protein [Rufibacter hautae]|uniref:TonB-dependent receptor plug domain-containing protein n=1 Tax=Rufibacter hautae TaxID=2595005 RepID=A0A5B6TJP0_9BACT|nr:MG2 domain-containing protein [Rufibacter hautae]KAA3440483.1 TonB-dependent receptor plug domain-containing protein [Rufibacter hautae]
MPPRLRLIPCLLLFVLATLFAFGPKNASFTTSFEEIIARFQRFTKEYPQEKVYLHLDKPYYAAGEDAWFKAYLVNAKEHTPSQLSKVLYVELLNPEDSVYSRVAVEVQNGLGHGDFALPDTIPAGQYRLRAYTSWMQNFDEEYFFHQNLTIYNPRMEDVVPSVVFEVKPQSKGDSVRVSLSLKNHQGEPLANTPFTYLTQTGRKTSAKQKGVTNAQGLSRFALLLSEKEDRQNTKLQLTVTEGQNAYVKSFPIPLPNLKPDLQFFPEGGNLVAGMWNVVGFKAVDATGLGADVSGAIYDQTGKKVTDFKSLKFGMGRIRFMPFKGMTYEARLSLPNGSSAVYPLPAAKEQGVLMTVDNSSPELIRLKVYLLGYADGVNRPKALHFLGQSRGEMYFRGTGTTGKDLVVVEVPRKSFPDGVSQITLFSGTGEPLAERLVFVNQGRQLRLSLTSDKTAYKPREKVTMRLQAKDEAGNPVAGTFSVAVTDQQKITPDVNGNNILTNLLLTSDLRGHIEAPGYYFSGQDPEAALALDNLMLTQGWRRFVWQDLLQSKPPQLTHPIEQALTVRGTVLKTSGKPEPNAVVNLFELSNIAGTLTDTTDAQGKFMFGVAGLDDSARIVVKALSAKGKNALEVVLEKGLPLTLAKPRAPLPPPPGPFSQELARYLQGNREQLKLDQLSGKSILLNTVNIKGRVQKEEDDYASRGLYSRPDRTLKAADLPPGMNLIASLQGRIAGLYVSGDNISMRGGGPPLFLLDGMPMEMEFFRTMSMSDVDRIDVLMPGASSAVYGSQGGNGVIAVSLKRGSAATPEISRWRGISSYKGIRYQTAREFYMPRYDAPAETKLPDLRSTIFWSPTITTNASGTAEWTFFAADALTTYQAVVEGITGRGQVGRGLATVQVR